MKIVAATCVPIKDIYDEETNYFKMMQKNIFVIFLISILTINFII